MAELTSGCGADSKGGLFLSSYDTGDEPLYRTLLGVLALCGLVFFFYGIAVVADVFMASIETVTNRRAIVLTADGRPVTQKVWNETVATLTLMALGSSAPEISLAVVDIFKKGFRFGALGPSTIVGSAAFNLLVIVAVCIITIPSDEVRWIKNIPAFYVTALFSLLAYAWMAFILSVCSPQTVDLWEAVMTFLLFPLMVYVSYKTDRGDLDQLWARCAKTVLRTSQDLDAKGRDIIGFVVAQISVDGSEAKEIQVTVARRGKAPFEPASVDYYNRPITATENRDFEAIEGTLEFESDETEKHINLSLLATPYRLTNTTIQIVLHEPTGPVKFDVAADGGEDNTAVLTVTLNADNTSNTSGFLRAFDRAIGINHFIAAMAQWRNQLASWIYVNGSLEEQREAGATAYFLHVLGLPWKLLVAVNPPPGLCGGWPCFCCALLFIAFLTAIISDLAELFGCILEIPDVVTAITFVALGTSMPDLFASLSAAKEDPDADAAIVNVTGSNAVNVYLGLGVPWTLAAMHWELQGERFEVEGLGLEFSVGAFTAVCVLALILLHLRRKWVLAELGGDRRSKVASSVALLFLWLNWVFAVSWNALRWNEASTTESVSVLGLCVAVATLCIAVPVAVMRQTGKKLSLILDTESATSLAANFEFAAEHEDGIGKVEAEMIPDTIARLEEAEKSQIEEVPNGTNHHDSEQKMRAVEETPQLADNDDGPDGVNWEHVGAENVVPPIPVLAKMSATGSCRI